VAREIVNEFSEAQRKFFNGFSRKLKLCRKFFQKKILTDWNETAKKEGANKVGESWRRVRDSNPQALWAAVFKTADLPISLTLRKGRCGKIVTTFGNGSISQGQRPQKIAESENPNGL
jgi:hypothetical protein